LVDKILDGGDKQEVRALFSFDSSLTDEEVLLNFRLWSRHFFYSYFSIRQAEFHKKIEENLVRVYRGRQPIFIDIAFRGAAKTTLTKLFIAFCIANDFEHKKRYFKILAADSDNSKQIVTDIYNSLINSRVRYYYPELFVKTEEKREERMASFTTATGIKVKAESVGMEQRGDIQENARPDFILFEDFETRKALRSAVLLNAIWDNMEEARTGLSIDGGCIYNCNYLSERGNVHKLIGRFKEYALIVPIVDKEGNLAWPAAYSSERLEIIRKNADDWAGEYLCEPSAGDDVFFDRQSLERQEKKQPVREVGGFKIFHEFDPSHRYGSGHDVAGGVGLDSSTSVFIDFTQWPNRVVGTFQNNKIKPDVFGYEIKRQADFFGEPVVAVENNKFDMCIGVLKRIYSKLYFTEQKETRAGMPPKIRYYGWNTNVASKPKMLFELKKAVEDGHLELSDPDLIAEAKSYSRDDLMDKEADPRLTTRHFDGMMAVAIAFQMRNFAEVKQEEDKGYQPKFERISDLEMGNESMGMEQNEFYGIDDPNGIAKW